VKPIEEAMIKRNLEYIRIEWADIHHSRQQEWGILVIIAGIFYAMAQVDPELGEHLLHTKLFLSVLGILGAFLGARICWQHYEILQHKISVIVGLERQIGIQYPMRKVRFSVQILIFLLFGGICSTFIGLTVGYIAEALGCDYRIIAGVYVVSGVVSFVLFRCYAVHHRDRDLRYQSYGYSHPFYAERQDLEQCLGVMVEIPLKLVANGTLDRPSTLSRPAIKEVVWGSPQWTWQQSSGAIIKPVLLNRRDVFQFSLANASSRQEWHQHSSTFEVYVSDNPIDLDYEEQGARKNLKVNRGVLIVPPGIPQSQFVGNHLCLPGHAGWSGTRRG
jgi:hypothetical protein